MSLFSSIVFRFVIEIDFSPLLNKFVCLPVNCLDKKLIVLAVTFSLSSRFDFSLGIKNVDPRW